MWQFVEVSSVQHHSCQCEARIHRRPESLLHAVLLLRVYFYVVLDLCCTYKLAYKINVGLRQKIYYGHLLENIQTFAKRFESYGMQRLFANSLVGLSLLCDFPGRIHCGANRNTTCTIQDRWSHHRRPA